MIGNVLADLIDRVCHLLLQKLLIILPVLQLVVFRDESHDLHHHENQLFSILAYSIKPGHDFIRNLIVLEIVQEPLDELCFFILGEVSVFAEESSDFLFVYALLVEGLLGGDLFADFEAVRNGRIMAAFTELFNHGPDVVIDDLVLKTCVLPAAFVPFYDPLSLILYH